MDFPDEVKSVELPSRVNYFDDPISVGCLVYRNINDDGNVSLVSVSKGCTSLL